jgi:quinol monooxygenase YgiN
MTIRHVARFAVRAEALEEALDAIRTFVAHTRTEPGTLRYESIQIDERPTEFLHVMEFADAEAEQAHASSEAVEAFTAVLYPLCTIGPTFEDWTPVEPGPDVR